MLAITKRSPRLPEKAFRRTRLISSWCSRISAVMFMAVERLGTDDAVLDQAVAGLEMLHAGIDVGIEGRRGAGRFVEIAGDDQAVAQRDDSRAGRAELQRAARRHLLPAAGLDELAILLDRPLGGIEGRLRQNRGRRALHGEARVGIVALGPFGLVAETVGGACRQREARRRRRNPPAAITRARREVREEKFWCVATFDSKKARRVRHSQGQGRVG